MLKLIGLLVILNSVVITGWWTVGDNPNKRWAVVVCLVAVFGGIFLVIHDRVTEITLKGVGTIKSAAESAAADAGVINDLRKRVEAQSATVDLVAQEASRAHQMAEGLVEKSGAVDKKMEAVDVALQAASAKVVELDQLGAFTSTVIAAQNDDRRAFDRLREWAADSSFAKRKEALDAYRTILDEHDKPFFMSGFSIPWKPGVNPSSLDLVQLKQSYGSAPVNLKPAFIEYIWKREDISRKQRLDFLADVVKSDPSLNAVEYAGRLLAGALAVKLKPLAVEQLLDEWKAKRDTLQE